MNGQPCVGYFQFDEDEYSIAMVLKDFWDQNGHLDDDGIDDTLIPPGFYALAESVYETDLPTEQAKAVLVAAGWQEKAII